MSGNGFVKKKKKDVNLSQGESSGRNYPVIKRQAGSWEGKVQLPLMHELAKQIGIKEIAIKFMKNGS